NNKVFLGQICTLHQNLSLFICAFVAFAHFGNLLGFGFVKQIVFNVFVGNVVLQGIFVITFFDIQFVKTVMCFQFIFSSAILFGVLHRAIQYFFGFSKPIGF